jgi:hypothetical protein
MQEQLAIGIDLEFNPLPAEPETDHCPICSQSLPISEFGVSRNRHTGRNLYCKACIRKKISDSRRELRSYHEKQKQLRSRDEEPAAPLAPGMKTRPLKERYNQYGALFYLELKLRSNPDHERVFGAIYYGARTQKEIRTETGLCKDAVGDALAILLLDHPKRIRTEVVDDVRVYCVAQQIRNSEIRNSERAA